MRGPLAWFISWVARFWVWSLRVHRIGAVIDNPSIAAFWHGEQLPLLRARPAGRESVAVSLSRDGELQAGIMTLLGMNVIRGSSSRGGFAAARGLLTSLGRGEVVLMAVDGPRGPLRQAKPGAVFLARRAGVPIYPVAVAVGSGMRLKGSWDQFLLPCPFSRICICVGEAWYPPNGLDVEGGSQALEELLNCAYYRAHKALSKDFS